MRQRCAGRLRNSKHVDHRRREILDFCFFENPRMMINAGLKNVGVLNGEIAIAFDEKESQGMKVGITQAVASAPRGAKLSTLWTRSAREEGEPLRVLLKIGLGVEVREHEKEARCQRR